MPPADSSSSRISPDRIEVPACIVTRVRSRCACSTALVRYTSS